MTDHLHLQRGLLHRHGPHLEAFGAHDLAGGFLRRLGPGGLAGVAGGQRARTLDEPLLEAPQLALELVDGKVQCSSVVGGGGLDAHRLALHVGRDLDGESTVRLARVGALDELHVCSPGSVENAARVAHLLVGESARRIVYLHVLPMHTNVHRGAPFVSRRS